MRVYVAGPITKGDRSANIRAGIQAADRLLDAGHAPYCPHLTCYWEIVTRSRPVTEWLTLDFAYLQVCDALIRLPGESEGADQEVAYALNHGIRVYLSVDEFLEEQSL